MRALAAVFLFLAASARGDSLLQKFIDHFTPQPRASTEPVCGPVCGKNRWGPMVFQSYNLKTGIPDESDMEQGAKDHECTRQVFVSEDDPTEVVGLRACSRYQDPRTRADTKSIRDFQPTTDADRKALEEWRKAYDESRKPKITDKQFSREQLKSNGYCTDWSALNYNSCKFVRYARTENTSSVKAGNSLYNDKLTTDGVSSFNIACGEGKPDLQVCFGTVECPLPIVPCKELGTFIEQSRKKAEAAAMLGKTPPEGAPPEEPDPLAEVPPEPQRPSPIILMGSFPAACNPAPGTKGCDKISASYCIRSNDNVRVPSQDNLVRRSGSSLIRSPKKAD